MGKFQRKPEYDLQYSSCVYSGISKMIDFEMQHGEDDRCEEIQYIVDRYCNEIVVSGNFLEDKARKYKEFAMEKYGVKD